ncbi:hypothetical protein CRE_13494 [Caenorhabditis remanei]|uniref:Uncharacterized protein n=1 Tax=Caenorhabditis remanei TaxID=31234 RepID=E3MRA6_CAERE|nr:hypothetical protein CRE_13494 [Caenorhabditis remanei]
MNMKLKIPLKVQKFNRPGKPVKNGGAVFGVREPFEKFEEEFVSSLGGHSQQENSSDSLMMGQVSVTHSLLKVDSEQDAPSFRELLSSLLVVENDMNSQAK